MNLLLQSIFKTNQLCFSVHIIRQNESRTAMSAPNFSRGNAVKPPPPLAGENIIEEESKAAEAEPMMQ